MEEIEGKIARVEESLRALTVCPDCGGSGELTLKRGYERLEGGAVEPRVEREACALCGGKERLEIPEISELV